MDTKKLKSFLPYLIIPLVIIGVAFYFVTSSAPSTKTKYYEVVEKFQSGTVTEYSLNLSSGALIYYVEGEKTPQKYTVPNVQIFVNALYKAALEISAID